MILIANFLAAIALVIKTILDIYLIIIIARVVLSWVNADAYNPIVRFINSATDPLFYWLRRRFPLVQGGMDFSPIVVFCIIYFLKAFLVQSMFDYSAQLKRQTVMEQIEDANL